MDENQTMDHDRIMKINIEEEMKSSSVLETPVTNLIRNVRVLLVRCSVSITLTATLLFTALWCVWDRSGTCVIP